MTNFIKTAEVKKRGIKKQMDLEKKLMIPDFEISKCPEHEVK